MQLGYQGLTFIYMSDQRPSSSDGGTILGGFLQRGGNEGAGIQIRVRADEMSKPTVAVGRPKGAGKGRKTRLAAMGLSPSIIKAGDPEYASCLDQANKYRKTRMKELAHLHGHVSAGAGALLASASLALAASRFLYQRAAEGGDQDESVAGYLKTAAKLADSARQSELAAWEMSSREGILKRRQEASEAGQPWLMPGGEGTAHKTGRKTNAERKAMEADVNDLPVVESYLEADDGGES